MIISRRVSLPYSSFLTAWLALELGELPTALLPARPVATGGTLDEVSERAWADLFERELAAGRTLAEDFAGSLRRLATASSRFYAFYHEGDGDTRSSYVAGAAVVATIDGDTVTLRRCWSDSGARALVDTLPKVDKAPGEALSAAADELTAASGIVTKVRATGAAARMRRVLALPRTGGGQLYAARLDRDGQRRMCERPLSYLDLRAGRLLATEHSGRDGTRWRTLVPADSALLIRRLTTLLPP